MMRRDPRVDDECLVCVLFFFTGFLFYSPAVFVASVCLSLFTAGLGQGRELGGGGATGEVFVALNGWLGIVFVLLGWIFS